MKSLFDIFQLEEITFQNANEKNLIKVLLQSCEDMESLRSLWSNLKTAGKFELLNNDDLNEIICYKNNMKRRYL
jgi:hypothetical protein